MFLNFKNLQVSTGLQEVKSWLVSKSQVAETDLSNISSPSELSKVKAKFQTIKDNIEQKSEAFDTIITLGKYFYDVQNRFS